MNKLLAKIVEIKTKDDFALVKLKAFKENFSSLMVQKDENSFFLKENKKVWMIFKESEVILAKKECNISLQNRFYCKVINIEHNEVLALVTLDYKGESLKSLITYDAICKLELKKDDFVLAFVKSNELGLMEYDG